MYRAPVLRVDRSVARTAFALHHGDCDAVIADECTTLELRRAGADRVLVTLAPLEVDEDGRLVFAWGDCLLCLAPGLYAASLISGSAPCGEVLLQLGQCCMVVATENIDHRSVCDGPDDTCAMTKTCAQAGTCAPPPVIYVPPYDVPRGC